MKLISNIVTSSAILMLLLSACKGKGADGSSADTAADSTAHANEVIVNHTLTRLPDTIFESARAVKYNIDIKDTTVTPTLSTLDDLYEGAPGVFTFRNGIHRLANFGGKVNGIPTGFEVVWSFETRFKGTWGGGSGWTGQPLYIEWPDSLRGRLTAKGLTNSGFSGKEIMVGSLNGNVYFIDYMSGKESRRPIDVNNPIKGTMSLDPTLNGNLYVGHGVPDTIPFGALTINLFDNKISNVFGRDPKAQRGWGAYDSSPLRVAQFVFRPGENGTIYKWYVDGSGMKLQSALRYTVNGAAPGVESSMAVYANYGYTGDNHGNILCFNLDTMKPVWCYKLGDDIDSSIVLIEENGHPYIYTGCEIDRQSEGTAKYIKLDGLNGKKQWMVEVPGRRREDGGKHFDGGFYSTALPGVSNCDSLLFVNCVLNTKGNNGIFMAINRYTGEVAYTTPLSYYSWSSPVGFTGSDDRMYVVTGDGRGKIYLIDGIDGRVISSLMIGNNFESSPAVIDDCLVVGSRGSKIYKIRVSTGQPPSQ